MIFTETRLKDALIIEPEKFEDDRGFFARIWDKKVFEQKGLETNWVQSSISFNKIKGTLRGMHFQTKPYEEIKMVRCTKGKIYDVIIDLRTSSQTFKKWMSIELSEQNHKILYIPKGFAHGFQTLEDNTEVFYQISEYHHQDVSGGIKWNDPEFSIIWPNAVSNISEKDNNFPNFQR
jgi:dTDP-4-dehydrorhamnose 3,5-epimerase